MSVRNPREVLAENGLIAKKSFGQNFLVDPTHKLAIARHVKDLGAELVFEIGSGLGALTDELLNKGLVVHAIERDRDMARIFRKEFADYLDNKQLILHEANATTFEFKEVAGRAHFAVCGNLPYHLTSTIIFQILELDDELAGCVFMIQKEVAERIVAAPGSKEYGILSVLVQALFNVNLVLEVPAGAFWPRPDVDSAVIRMTPLEPKILADNEFQRLKVIVKKAFSQRRKTLRNCLKGLIDVDAISEKTGISGEVRPETLSPTQFITLMRVSQDL